MKRTVLIVLAFGALAFSSSVYAQTNAELIEMALAAAPRRAVSNKVIGASQPTFSSVCATACSAGNKPEMLILTRELP